MRWVGVELDAKERRILDYLLAAEPLNGTGFRTVRDLAAWLGESDDATEELVRSLDRRGLVFAAPSRIKPSVVTLAGAGKALVDSAADSGDPIRGRAEAVARVAGVAPASGTAPP
jgi:hypothetical protein